MSSLAQEESRSISENVTWGQRKRMAEGKVTIPYGRFLGYRKGANGLPEIIPEEAETVRLIYRSFMEGMTPGKIVKMLMQKGIPAPGGGDKWYTHSINSILTNEKYKGSAVFQKKFTVDFLTKKQKVNEGEVPQYYVEESHPAIIEPEEFEMVQAEVVRRKMLGKAYSSSNLFASKLVCACCGGYFGPKVWHSTSKYRRIIWQCNHKFQNGERCKTPHLYEEVIKQKFITVCGMVDEIKDDFIDSCREAAEVLCDCTKLDRQIELAINRCNEITETMQAFIRENAAHAQDQKLYDKKFVEYEEKSKVASDELHKLREKKAEQISRKELLDGMIREIEENDLTVTEFDEKLWRLMVESVVVDENGKMTFKFRNEMEIEV